MEESAKRQQKEPNDKETDAFEAYIPVKSGDVPAYRPLVENMKCKFLRKSKDLIENASYAKEAKRWIKRKHIARGKACGMRDLHENQKDQKDQVNSRIKAIQASPYAILATTRALQP